MALNGPVIGRLTRRRGELGFAAVLVAVAGLAFHRAGDYPGVTGTYPRVLAVLLGIGGVLVILRTLTSAREDDATAFFEHGLRALLGFGALALYLIGIGLLGYLIPSLILGIAVPLLLGLRNLRLPVLATLGTLVFILVVFVSVLQRPLPPDLLDPLLKVLR